MNFTIVKVKIGENPNCRERIKVCGRGVCLVRGHVINQNHQQNGNIEWCFGGWKAYEDPILFSALCLLLDKALLENKWYQLPPLSLWVLLIGPYHIHTYIPHPHKNKPKFWTSGPQYFYLSHVYNFIFII